jgi:hypothetical protein
MQAVRAATAHRPGRAQQLLDILRAAPEVVRRKPDRYGPLGLLVRGRPPLPPQDRRRCELFAREWLRGDFGVDELANALEEALLEVTGRPQSIDRHRAGGWHTLAGQAHGPHRLIRRADRPP